MASKDRFSLISHDENFLLLDMMTGQESWFGSGIAAIVDGKGETVSARRPDFVEIVEALLNTDVSRTLDEYFIQWWRPAVSAPLGNPSAREQLRIRLQSSGRDPILEFRHAEDGSIQRREYVPQEESQMGPEDHWQTLSRHEVMHYLNYGGAVGVWLNDLRDQGLIQIRRDKRAASVSGK